MCATEERKSQTGNWNCKKPESPRHFWGIVWNRPGTKLMNTWVARQSGTAALGRVMQGHVDRWRMDAILRGNCCSFQEAHDSPAEFMRSRIWWGGGILRVLKLVMGSQVIHGISQWSRQETLWNMVTAAFDPLFLMPTALGIESRTSH